MTRLPAALALCTTRSRHVGSARSSISTASTSSSTESKISIRSSSDPVNPPPSVLMRLVAMIGICTALFNSSKSKRSDCNESCESGECGSPGGQSSRSILISIISAPSLAARIAFFTGHAAIAATISVIINPCRSHPCHRVSLPALFDEQPHQVRITRSLYLNP